MKVILDREPCYDRRAESMQVELTNGEGESIQIPALPILRRAKLALNHRENINVDVNILLDTGNDVTIVDPRKIQELESLLDNNEQIDPRGATKFFGEHQPIYDLMCIFPGGNGYSSECRFIAPDNWEFDVADVFLGQDIFSQLSVTFDAVSQEVTIIDPRR